MNKKQLIKMLNSVPDDLDIFIHCSYNNYDIKHIVDTGNSIVLIVGDTVNIIETEFDPEVA